MPTEQHNNRLALCRDKAKQEDISAAAEVALENSITKRRLLMQRDFFMLGSYKVLDNMRARCASPAVAEPLAADIALYNR